MTSAVRLDAPRPTRFDLCWRVGGVPFRITPLFWFSCALLGLRYFADPEAGSLGYFLFWMLAACASLMLHELGHLLVGRLLGMQGETILYGLGGMTTGVEALSRRWQRLLVLLAGPAVQLLFVSLLWALAWLPFPGVFREWGWQAPIANGLFILLWINLYWALLNLIPLWPLDGGRMACEIGEAIFGPRGRSIGLSFSIVCAGLLAMAATLQLSSRLSFPYDPRYLLYLMEYCISILYLFLLWLRNFSELWNANKNWQAS
jgi:stage IV sporulation protein FB